MEASLDRVSTPDTISLRFERKGRGGERKTSKLDGDSSRLKDNMRENDH
jgi:hypothetical protein